MSVQGDTCNLYKGLPRYTMATFVLRPVEFSLSVSSYVLFCQSQKKSVGWWLLLLFFFKVCFSLA